VEGGLEGGWVHRSIVEPVESAVGGLANAGVVAAVGARPDVVDHAHQPVLHCDAFRGRPAQGWKC